MENTPFLASQKHREGEIQESHDEIRDYYDFKFCPWCGVDLIEELQSRGKEDEQKEMPEL